MYFKGFHFCLKKKKKRNPEYALMFTEEEAMEWDL